MKAAAILAERKSDPSVAFAVKVPRMRYGRRDGSDVVESQIEDVMDGRAFLAAAPSRDHPVTHVPLASVLATWDAYRMEQIHAEALHADAMRTHEMQYQAERAERVAHMERFLPVFDGMAVPADALSTSNVARPDEDLGASLRRTFVEEHASGSMFRWEVFEAVAKRLQEMQEAITLLQGGWGGSGADTGSAEVTYLPPRADIDAIEARLDEIAAGGSPA